MQMNEIISYRDLLKVSVLDNNERFVSLSKTNIMFGYNAHTKSLFDSMGKQIYVREGVLSRLLSANKILQKFNSNYGLYVLEGYRSLQIQTDRFLSRISQIKDYYEDPVDLYEKIHESIAVPSVAGHPTGGAVDVLIWDKEKDLFLDFGSEIYDFSNNMYLFETPGLTAKQKENREILRSVLTKAEFYSYDGEYWHFSYGDREWAVGKGRNQAIYDQVLMKRVIGV